MDEYTADMLSLMLNGLRQEIKGDYRIVLADGSPVVSAVIDDETKSVYLSSSHLPEGRDR
jgi:hypothetical protein